MKNNMIILMLLLMMAFPCYAEKLSYCEGSKVSANENKLLNDLIVQFAKKMGCEIGNNCITQWEMKSNSAKFSIAWKERCGPVIHGIYQLGDQGLGSTFVCMFDAQKTCCWPLGYDYVKDYVKCM